MAPLLHPAGLFVIRSPYFFSEVNKGCELLAVSARAERLQVGTAALATGILVVGTRETRSRG
ncbi:hypothetical protein DP114_00605 [Brasilonema sennae CENA114]|uniref:Uncharacterized protein n=1 Tax=Brasilonema sennae CENA114 TaxID=415709 RepID=A0A856M9D1_9CYAN|nr:hypothetical protein DP114_00605 [Brasilonema sennae CENA114]